MRVEILTPIFQIVPWEPLLPRAQVLNYVYAPESGQGYFQNIQSCSKADLGHQNLILEGGMDYFRCNLWFGKARPVILMCNSVYQSWRLWKHPALPLVKLGSGLRNVKKALLKKKKEKKALLIFMAPYLPFQHPSAPKFPVFPSVPNSIPSYGIHQKELTTYSTPCDITEVPKWWPLMFLFGHSVWTLQCCVVKPQQWQEVKIHHFRHVLCSSQHK